ncbi:MAG: succinylglutamate desuccinylase/aspartoacylase family protein [Rubrivivax sp.]|nr:succinylglutamate desuccinylase/aspartoacylase family protein [Rubrivivax sp.]
MPTETLELIAPAPGQRAWLTVHRYGTPGGTPKAVIQAALHADEVPPLLVAQQLRRRLAELDAAGQVAGEVVLVPYANPLGLGQHPLGLHQGRFDLRDGVNFNRQVPDLSAAVADAVAGRLGDDPARNVALVRAALREAADALPAEHPAQDLKRRLLRLAVDADIVLDLHCDTDAVMHLYALTPQSALAEELGALLGAQAVLLATDSGDSPFDEACSRPWLVVQQRFPDHPVPLACFSPTVELRGEADTGHELAAQDADAIVEFLRRRGVVASAPRPLPAPRCTPTPLAAAEQLNAPGAGVVVFHARPGERVEAGALVADLVDIDSGAVRPLLAQSSGLLYARMATRWATPGRRVAGIAGTTLQRSGKLLGP